MLSSKPLLLRISNDVHASKKLASAAGNVVLPTPTQKINNYSFWTVAASSIIFLKYVLGRHLSLLLSSSVRCHHHPITIGLPDGGGAYPLLLVACSSDEYSKQHGTSKTIEP